MCLPRLASLSIFCSSFLSIQLCHSQTVGWGTSASPSGKPQLFLPDGTPMPAGYPWELGWFDAGFTPTMANAAQWASKWHTVAASSVNPAPDYDVSVITYDVGAVAAGKRGWIWAFSNKAAMGQPGASALLVTETDWIFPSMPNFEIFDLADNELSTVDDQMTVVMGRVDRRLDSAGGLLCKGLVPNPLPDSKSPDFSQITFEVQAATWPSLGQVYAADWRLANFTAPELANAAISGWNVDPDGDGMSNLHEYVYGGNPKQKGTAPPLSIQIGNNRANLSIQISANALVKIAVEESSNLLDWGASDWYVNTNPPNWSASVAILGGKTSRYYRLIYSPIE